MKMKKLALLLVAPVVLAACGNEQAPAEPEETATESVVEENKKVDEKDDKKMNDTADQKDKAADEDVKTEKDASATDKSDKSDDSADASTPANNTAKTSTSEKADLVPEEEQAILDRIVEIAGLEQDIMKYTFMVLKDDEAGWVKVEIRELSEDNPDVSTLHKIYRYNSTTDEYQVYNEETDSFE
ncbi:hypothetical protein [Dolosigranulum savutiense]|uniref:Uncharacterized protein n=1 Tax=Dolosigranulum savutiense TaxID=3110288 RepID=A0AB74UA91_9LACT